MELHTGSVHVILKFYLKKHIIFDLDVVIRYIQYTCIEILTRIDKCKLKLMIIYVCRLYLFINFIYT